MIIKTAIHTVFILVGPTECGKSTFVDKVLVPQLMASDASKNFKMNVQVISSDQIRRELLGSNYDKHDSIMMEASGQAFDLLGRRLDAVTSFPINAEFVVVDTKGLSEEFRNSVIDTAKRNQYNVEVILFDYKSTQDYYIEGTKSKDLVARDVRKLRTEVMMKLKKGQFSHVHRVRAKDFLDANGKASPDYQVTIENLEAYMQTLIPVNSPFFVIGDVHEELEALKQAFRDKGFKLDGERIVATERTGNMKAVLVGDYLDKGGNTEAVIRFIQTNREHFILVVGNHENFVYKYLKGEISGDTLPEDLIPTYFTSIAVLEQNEELKEQFFELFESSVPFAHYVGIRNNSVYITHAPCPNRFIGKLDFVSQKKQRNFQVDREKPLQDQLVFIEKEAVLNHPFHLFGHVASANGIRIKNKLGIDTGAVHGNRLTTVEFYQGKTYLKSVNVAKEDAEELPTLFERKKQNVSLAHLSDDDRRRLFYVLRNKINFISGTISPADKDTETGELESLKKGLEYFRSRGVESLSMQPKYMGSRCTVYLGKTVDDCYAVSRNGYKIRNVDLTSVYEALIQKHSAWIEKDNLSLIILDGELMPWMTLGKGLIERQFKVIDIALQQELALLKETGFEAQLHALAGEYEGSAFASEQQKLSKKDLIQKYGEATYGKLKNVREAMKSYHPLQMHEEAHQLYHEQIELFGSDGPIEFKPFAILKLVRADGSEYFPMESQSESFAKISDDHDFVVSFADSAYLEKATAYYETLTTDRKMEGVVLKPQFDKAGVAPAIKVRNPQYLRIIYGYDYSFPNKYKKLFDQKHIGKKLDTSIREYEFGKDMLAVPLCDIEKDNKGYQQVVANMLFETSKEAGIDPRL